MSVSEEQLRITLRQFLNVMASAINLKDTGLYLDETGLAGQYYYQTTAPSSTTSTEGYVLRDVLRLVVPIPALSSGANAIAHGLTPTTSWDFTRIYGVIKGTAPLTYVPVPNSTILVTVDATNVNINIPAAYAGYTGNVVLEWVETS
jgi:hypothetical protein